MSSPAQLPSDAVEESLLGAISAVMEAAETLDDLKGDERFRIWNLGGRPFGAPHRRGPGWYSADELAALAWHLKGRLQAIEDSFQHRRMREAQRAS